MRHLIGGPVHIIGLGCGGSAFAEKVAMIGPACVDELHGWDCDVVGVENVGAQTYLKQHVGMKKVDALAEQVREWGGIKLIRHDDKIDGPRPFSGAVVVAVDKMSTRWLLWEHSIRRNPNVWLMVELRLEARGAYIFTANPNDPRHIKRWERYWYPDNEATTAGSCSAATRDSSIARHAAAACFDQLLWARRGGDLSHMIRIQLND